jgi:hypothetical protein
MLDAERLKAMLGLRPLEPEGGFYVETYRSDITLPADVADWRCGPSKGPRSLATAIYYLLTPDTCSALHRLASDEVYHFYLGDPAEMLLLWPDGTSDVITLGRDIEKGMQVQMTVPAGVWQGSRLIEGGGFALLGTTMAPGFDPADFERASRDDLVAAYPDRRDLITALVP